jgi:AcrR family transcriptional regulator
MVSKPKRTSRRKKAAAERRDPVETALDLFAERGYAAVTLAGIAGAAGLSLAELMAQFPRTSALVTAWLGRIDAAMLEAAAPADDETARDRLFEVIMGRLDLLGPRKDLVRALSRAAARDPAGLGCALGLALRRSLRWMLAAAGIESEGWRGTVIRQGLALIYADTARHWLRDDSPDSAGTMAHLDKRLRQAAGLMGRVPHRRTRSDGSATAAH